MYSLSDSLISHLPSLGLGPIYIVDDQDERWFQSESEL